MRFHRAGAIAAAVLMTSGCATLQNGTAQRIRVNSTPPGAQVFLNGQPVGTTPTQIVVSRRNREPVIRVERDGFSPFEQTLQRRGARSVLWNVALGVFLVPVTGRLLLDHDDANPTFPQTLAAWSVGAAPLITDYATGAAFEFTPGIVDAPLAPAGVRRMEVPDRLRAALRRSLTRASDPGGRVRRVAQPGNRHRGTEPLPREPRDDSHANTRAAVDVPLLPIPGVGECPEPRPEPAREAHRQ